jgi:hypothetical protein
MLLFQNCKSPCPLLQPTRKGILLPVFGEIVLSISKLWESGPENMAEPWGHGDSTGRFESADVEVAVCCNTSKVLM